MANTRLEAKAGASRRPLRLAKTETNQGVDIMTDQERNAVMEVFAALYEAVKASPRGAPGGHLYAAVMGHLTLDQFNQFMSALCKSGKVRRSGECYFAN